jgi:RNA polymerase sigma-70 factor (ECF subfamily)
MIPLGSEISEIEIEVRTQTLTYLRTQVKDRMAQLREELPTDDQTLLVLRVDKQLG